MVESGGSMKTFLTIEDSRKDGTVGASTEQVLSTPLPCFLPYLLSYASQVSTQTLGPTKAAQH